MELKNQKVLDSNKKENWKVFDCFNEGCGECEICEYLDFLDKASSTAPDGSTIEYNEKLDDYIKRQDKYKNEALQEGKSLGIQECIDLSDKIERQEPDGGTKQWVAFKHFRNTMRDNLTLKNKDEEK